MRSLDNHVSREEQTEGAGFEVLTAVSCSRIRRIITTDSCNATGKYNNGSSKIVPSEAARFVAPNGLQSIIMNFFIVFYNFNYQISFIPAFMSNGNQSLNVNQATVQVNLNMQII
jgi:hypothetical protein